MWMANGFSVDLGALKQASDGVNGTLAQIDAQDVGDIGHDASAIGQDQVADTLSDFLSRWQLGVHNLQTDGKQIAARLAANLRAYQAAEQNAADHFDRIHQELTGSGADPGEH
jgi:hypothetical protein